MRRPATVTVTPRPTRRDVADPPPGHYGQSFQLQVQVESFRRRSLAQLPQ